MSRSTRAALVLLALCIVNVIFNVTNLYPESVNTAYLSIGIVILTLINVVLLLHPKWRKPISKE